MKSWYEGFLVVSEVPELYRNLRDACPVSGERSVYFPVGCAVTNLYKYVENHFEFCVKPFKISL